MIKAEYIDHMGSDLTVVNAARVSFDKESKEMGRNDERLISYLAKHNHFTPFTHAVITLRETVPIFVARQRFKHTVGFTYNEVSRRYVDDAPEFYTPKEWRGKPVNAKQGSSDEVVTTILRGPAFNLSSKFGEGTYLKPSRKEEDIQTSYERLIREVSLLYSDMIEAGVAPEQARMILPQSMMTSYYVTGSLAAFARAYQLRSSEDSQYEIRLLADEWASIIAPLFPVSWNALTKKD